MIKHFTFIVLLFGCCVAFAQNEDMPYCAVSRDIIIKNNIHRLVEENRNYLLGFCRKKYSWKQTYTFDSAAKIISQDWVSLKGETTGHLTTFKYDAHGNLTNRKIAAKNLNIETTYFYKYDSSGLVQQYYTQYAKRLLFNYNGKGLLTKKLEIIPTDTLQEWNYIYDDTMLLEIRHKLRGISTLFVTIYKYETGTPVFMCEKNDYDTLRKIAYSYNATGNKIEEKETSATGNKTQKWEYNTLGKLTRYTVNSNNNIDTKKYVYDNNGFLVKIKTKYNFIFGVVDKSIFYYQ